MSNYCIYIYIICSHFDLNLDVTVIIVSIKNLFQLTDSTKAFDTNWVTNCGFN